MEDFGAKSSIGRPGQPSEVATSFVFLASNEASLFCKFGHHRYADASWQFLTKIQTDR